MSHTSLGKIADPIFTLTTGPVDAYPAVLQNLFTMLKNKGIAFQPDFKKAWQGHACNGQPCIKTGAYQSLATGTAKHKKQ